MKGPRSIFVRVMLTFMSLSNMRTDGARQNGWENQWTVYHPEQSNRMSDTNGYHALPRGAEIIYLPYYIGIPTGVLPLRVHDVPKHRPKLAYGGRSILGNLVGAVKYTTLGVLNAQQNILHGIMQSVVKPFARTTLQIGKIVIASPLRGLERTIRGTGELVAVLGSNLAKVVTALPGAGMIESVKSVTFGNISVFPLSTSLTAVVDPIKNAVFSIVSTTRKMINAAEAMVIYQTSNLIASMLGPLIKTIGFDCIQIPRQYVEVNQFVVNSVEMKSGAACGLANLIAQSNVTLTKDDKAFLIVRIPLKLKNTAVHMNNVTVQGLFGPMLDGANVDILVDDFHFYGDVEFRRWSVMQFVAIHMRVSEMRGFRVEFKGTEEKSPTMSILESLSTIFESIIVKQMNTAFEKMEDSLSKSILGS